MGVDVPDEVMVVLSERRISLLIDHQANQLVQHGQAATGIMMSTVLSVSGELKLASVAMRNDTRELGLTWKPEGSATAWNWTVDHLLTCVGREWLSLERAHGFRLNMSLGGRSSTFFGHDNMTVTLNEPVGTHQTASMTERYGHTRQPGHRSHHVYRLCGRHGSRAGPASRERRARVVPSVKKS